MRNSILKSFLGLSAASLMLFSCNKETTDLSDMEKGHDFAPYEIGKYILYDVDTLYWDDLLEAQVPRRCQLRYDVADTFRDGAGRLSYVINVQIRDNEGDPFRPNDVIKVTPTATNLIWSQKNLDYIKLVFPVSTSTSWDGNAMIPLGDQDYAEFDNDKWDYTYTDFDKSYKPGAKLYEHTVTVNQIDDQLNDPDVDSSAYAYRNYAQEVYAYSVGMVFRERIYWVFQPKPGGSGYRKGYSVIMRAVDNN